MPYHLSSEPGPPPGLEAPPLSPSTSHAVPLVAAVVVQLLLAASPVGATTWKDSASRQWLAPELSRLQATLKGTSRSVPERLPDRLPLLLVDFADRPHSESVPPDTMLTRYFGSVGSVASFFERSSYGRFHLQGEGTPWLRLPETLATYANGLGGVGNTYPRNAQRMVEDAVRAADAWIDFSLYNNDGPDGIPSSGDDDGFVDGVMVVHAGAGAELGDPGNILSHSLFTSEPIETDDGPAVWLYATASETSPLGTHAHEFGHLLGLPDLYQLGGRRGTAGGLGDWSLMASGAWGGDGWTPTDLDAPSKIELGFVDPIVPTGNTSNLRLRAELNGLPPDVYQVWTHGELRNESFVIINRRRQGLDAALPAGGGMLVYHVDRHRAGNADRDSLRVQLLQADARRDLELFVNNGDEGDPFPGTAANVRLDSNTTPSTRTRHMQDSQVVIQLRSSPSSEMRFDLQVESQSSLRLITHRLREQVGDGNGVVDPGESATVEIWWQNIGLATDNLMLQARVDPLQGILEQDQAVLGPVAKGDTLRATFVLQTTASLADPSAIPLTIHATDAVPATQQEFVVSLAIGQVQGFLACLEPPPSSLTQDCNDPAGSWQTRALRGPANWTAEVVPGELGLVYRSAASATYPNNADMVLVSPPFNLEARSSLQLLHEWDSEDLGGGLCMDGGLVEVSLSGGPWTAMQPVAGAPRRLWGDSVGYLADVPVFGGRGGRRWDTFDLGDRQGSAQVRFRFVSGDSIRARGWSLFRVEVTSGNPTTPQSASLRVAIEPNPVRIPSDVRFRVDASRETAARTTQLSIYDVRGHLVHRLEHRAVPAQTARFVWDGTDRAGVTVASGLYFAQVRWGSQLATAKLIVLH